MHWQRKKKNIGRETDNTPVQSHLKRCVIQKSFEIFLGIQRLRKKNIRSVQAVILLWMQKSNTMKILFHGIQIWIQILIYFEVPNTLLFMRLVLKNTYICPSAALRRTRLLFLSTASWLPQLSAPPNNSCGCDKLDRQREECTLTVTTAWKPTAWNRELIKHLWFKRMAINALLCLEVGEKQMWESLADKER